MHQRPTKCKCGDLLFSGSGEKWEKLRLSWKHIYTHLKRIFRENINRKKYQHPNLNSPQNQPYARTHLLIIYVNHSLATRQQAEPTHTHTHSDNYGDNQTECARYVFEILWKVVPLFQWFIRFSFCYSCSRSLAPTFYVGHETYNSLRTACTNTCLYEYCEWFAIRKMWCMHAHQIDLLELNQS